MDRNYWDKIASNYQKSVREDKNADFAYENQVNSLSILSLCDNFGVALDLGCGDGRFTRLLEAKYEKVYAIDFSNKMMSYAKKNCKNTEFVTHDLEKPFPKLNQKFDLIVAKLLLMYMGNIQNLADESFKLLNNNGIMVVSVTHPFKWVVEKLKGNISENYKGYLSQVLVRGAIARNKQLTSLFFNRTLETYVNTFTKSGFYLETVCETGVPDAFVIKYPKYREFQKKPYRLNLKFIKK